MLKFISLKWMTPSTLPAILGNTISPMLSRRTSFQTFLQELAQRHDQLDKALPVESSAKSCLAIKHPAFTCEIKVGFVASCALISLYLHFLPNRSLNSATLFVYRTDGWRTRLGAHKSGYSDNPNEERNLV